MDLRHRAVECCCYCEEIGRNEEGRGKEPKVVSQDLEVRILTQIRACIGKNKERAPIDNIPLE